MSEFYTTQVKVEGGILWVGSDAYPLRQISHVGSRMLDPSALKAKAWTRFIIRTLICLVVFAILTAASVTAAVIVLLAVEALLVWQLVSTLKLQTVYGLVLNTSGVQHDAIWSRSAAEIRNLVAGITNAIGHPDTANMVVNINHAVNSDIIQQFGSGNIGKQVHTGSGDNVAGDKESRDSGTPSVVVHGGDYVAREKTVTQLGDTHHWFGVGPDESPDAGV